MAIPYLIIGNIEFPTRELPPTPYLALRLSDWWRPPELKGSDTEVPLRHGAIPRKRRRAATRRITPILIDGFVTLEGGIAADPALTLEEHMSRLANLQDPTNDVEGLRDSQDGTLGVELGLHSGEIKTGRCHVVDTQIEQTGLGFANAVIDVSLPAGDLVTTKLGDDAGQWGITTKGALEVPSTFNGTMGWEFTPLVALTSTHARIYVPSARFTTIHLWDLGLDSLLQSVEVDTSADEWVDVEWPEPVALAGGTSYAIVGDLGGDDYYRSEETGAPPSGWVFAEVLQDVRGRWGSTAGSYPNNTADHIYTIVDLKIEEA